MNSEDTFVSCRLLFLQRRASTGGVDFCHPVRNGRRGPGRLDVKAPQSRHHRPGYVARRRVHQALERRDSEAGGGRRACRGRLSRRQPGYAVQPRSRRRLHQELREKFGVDDRRLDRRAAGTRSTSFCSRVSTVGLTWNRSRPVFKAHKPVFIDKPVAGTLADAIAIFDLARETNTPCFSSSSLRFGPGIAAMRHDSKIGDVSVAMLMGPAHLEEHHPDLFWYGVHGVETLFTIMGTGCRTVSRTQTEGTELVVGVWNDGRVGTFRGIRAGPLQVWRDRLRHQGECSEWRLRRLRTPGRRDRQVLQDGQASGQCRGDDRDLRLHGSRR